MEVKKILLIVALFVCKISNTQEISSKIKEIDRLASDIDSSEVAKQNIGRFRVVLYMHNEREVDYVFVIDTIGKNLFKCIYEDYENISTRINEYKAQLLTKVIFYFYKGKLIKEIILEFKQEIQIDSVVLHWENKNILSSLEKGLFLATSPKWDTKRINEKSDEFLVYFSGILDMINKRNRKP